MKRSLILILAMMLSLAMSVSAIAATMGESNALRSAGAYLAFSAFSYTGLIDQLEFEGYTTAEATYAADHCGADWDEQAAKSAQNYLSFTAFSLEGLIGQLEYEGFTPEQANYGANLAYSDSESHL